MGGGKVEGDEGRRGKKWVRPIKNMHENAITLYADLKETEKRMSPAADAPQCVADAARVPGNESCSLRDH